MSLLKEKLGTRVSAQPQLPLRMEDQDGIRVRPQPVLDKRKRLNKIEILEHWQGLQPTKATWEDLRVMKQQFTEYAHEGKGSS